MRQRKRPWLYEVQFTKHFGLKKLRKIAQGDSRWRVSPFIVLDSAENFRRAKMLGMPRALARTDEAGRVYQKLGCMSMPRGDIMLSATSDKRIKQKLGEYLLVDKLRGSLGGKAKLIVHPTKPRGKMRWTGSVTIRGGRCEVKLKKNPPAKQQLHKQLYDTEFEAQVRNGAVEIRNDKGQSREVGKILDSLRAFVETALKKRQIKASRSSTLYFVVWKDAPGIPEFYDLVEKRNRPYSYQYPERHP